MTIYFISDGEFVKIGYTEGSAEDRRKALQTGNPKPLKVVGTMSGDQSLEFNLHSQFSEHRVSGEWFKMAPSITTFIQCTTGKPMDKTAKTPHKPIIKYPRYMPLTEAMVKTNLAKYDDTEENNKRITKLVFDWVETSWQSLQNPEGLLYHGGWSDHGLTQRWLESADKWAEFLPKLSQYLNLDELDAELSRNTIICPDQEKLKQALSRLKGYGSLAYIEQSPSDTHKASLYPEKYFDHGDFGISDALNEVFGIKAKSLEYKSSLELYPLYRRWFNPRYYNDASWKSYCDFVRNTREEYFINQRADTFHTYVDCVVAWARIDGQHYLELNLREKMKYFNQRVLSNGRQRLKSMLPEYASKEQVLAGFYQWCQDNGFDAEYDGYTCRIVPLHSAA